MTPRPAGRLLAERAGVDVDPAVRDQLVAGTGGNPLALVELAGALAPTSSPARRRCRPGCR